MKEEVKRIMKLVQEGKLSPDDAAELIEAFNEAPEEAPQQETAGVGAGVAAESSEGAKTEDPFSKLIGSIEKIGKDVAKNVNWNDIANQVRQGVGKGVDAIKHAAEDAKRGGGFTVFFGSSQVKRVQLPLSVPEGKTLRIEVKSGDVIVEGGAEYGTLSIDATFRSYDEEEAKKMAEAYTPVLEESDYLVVFRQPEGANLTADVTARVPEGVPVEIKVASGDISVIHTKASVRIDGSSGDVVLKNVAGSVQVSERSGNVTILDTEASVLAVDTKSGDVKIERSAGVIEVKTSSGDVKVLDSMPKTLSIDAASGDIKVDLAAPVESAVNITAVSGNVGLAVSDGNDCRVSLSTLRGAVASRVELEDETKDEHKVTGRLGAGTGTLDVSVVTGNIDFGLRDSLQA